MTLHDWADADWVAGLVVACEAGLVPATDVTAVLDQVICERADPPIWLIDASLANEPDALLDQLRDQAGDHPMLTDRTAFLDAVDLRLAEGDADVIEVGRRVATRWPYADAPKHLEGPLADLFEEATCGGRHGGVIEASLVEASLRAVLRAAAVPGRWRGLLEELRRTSRAP